jgi:hypothetical protein
VPPRTPRLTASRCWTRSHDDGRCVACAQYVARGVSEVGNAGGKRTRFAGVGDDDDQLVGVDTGQVELGEVARALGVDDELAGGTCPPDLVTYFRTEAGIEVEAP